MPLVDIQVYQLLLIRISGWRSGRYVIIAGKSPMSEMAICWYCGGGL